jgi:hypothetical protein
LAQEASSALIGERAVVSLRQMSDSSIVRRYRIDVLPDGSIALTGDDGKVTRVDRRDAINGIRAPLWAAFNGRTVEMRGPIIDLTASHQGQAFIIGGAEKSVLANRH